ncbi:glutamyl-tRNA reductase [Desulfosarcina alkanivorans]|jgi:glutamyl-tRNA reductase|uniref:Glutamyl-tRNA reductase n=1 Tax=Desulfosarcina alkanivorans TaxID=571177 RepID=A0A5K7YL95_9BACT|nr:glutamyl-tRNA reductase [Desulfosarcina alkanivorans]BBO69986.1 glutamyl-tRNA reductase [Desulfosarcina alkanivorans]
MRDIVLLGLNHKTASVDVRECIAFTAEETDRALMMLRENPAIGESVLFSTCNRIELLMAVDDRRAAVAIAKQFIAEFKKIPLSRFESSLYLYEGDDAVRHAFQVAASLDSMVVGEPQILGQMKEAYRKATLESTSGTILNKLLHRTFFVAKKVRTETGIGDHAVSISYAAIELGKKIFGDLEGKRVMLIGAGEMAELAVDHLIRNRAGTITVANRTFARGVELADRFRGKAINFEEIIDGIKDVDIVISSTGATEYVLHKNQIKDAMKSRRNRSLFFIDIAVPRDIDPGINRISNAYVYDIDDLKGIVDENVEDRNREAVKARRIIDEAVIGFRRWYDTLEVVPTIVSLRGKVEAMARQELEKTLGSLSHLSDTDKRAIERMTSALVNKILHGPTDFLKKDGCHGNKSASLDLTRKLFNLEENQ